MRNNQTDNIDTLPRSGSSGDTSVSETSGYSRSSQFKKWLTYCTLEPVVLFTFFAWNVSSECDKVSRIGPLLFIF